MEYLSVSHLTAYLKLKFDRDPYLEKVYLTGEVSNFRRRPTHQYFSIKDEGAVIQATMWQGVYRKLGFELEEGMKINIVGRIQLYAPSGSYSVIIEKAEPDGVGALAIQFEQLKKKLAQAGYFEDRHKQSLPQFARKVGVVTSPSGAVIRDIHTTISRRFSGVEILLFPTKVQGEGAAQEIAENIRKANERTDLDLLIIGRGGGSIEDLWAFNEEVVVQAIFESRLPVISSVGHETDTTLADFVADRRAATPTAAAELATPVTKADLLAWIGERKQRAYQAVLRTLTLLKEQLESSRRSVIFRQPERLYDGYVQKVDQLTSRLVQEVRQRWTQEHQGYQLLQHRLMAIDLLGRLDHFKERMYLQEKLLIQESKRLLQQKKTQVERYQEALLTLDTSRIVARGYAMLTRDQQVLSSVADLTPGEQVDVTLKDGQARMEVLSIDPTSSL